MRMDGDPISSRSMFVFFLVNLSDFSRGYSPAVPHPSNALVIGGFTSRGAAALFRIRFFDETQAEIGSLPSGTQLAREEQVAIASWLHPFNELFEGQFGFRWSAGLAELNGDGDVRLFGEGVAIANDRGELGFGSARLQPDKAVVAMSLKLLDEAINMCLDRRIGVPRPGALQFALLTWRRKARAVAMRQSYQKRRALNEDPYGRALLGGHARRSACSD